MSVDVEAVMLTVTSNLFGLLLGGSVGWFIADHWRRIRIEDLERRVRDLELRP
jgi:hypothetical protein